MFDSFSIQKKSGRIIGLAMAGLLAVGVAGCSPTKPEVTASAEGVTAAVEVSAVDNAYYPQTVTVKVGEAVRWTFDGGAKHDVVAADGSFVSELQKDGSFTHVFTEPGKYDYDCSIHPEMRGTVIVEE
ncbi:cupredoxin domain-containing protein [Canibacter zhoujuaniae]|uniref:cupredoxin domain-containing protein n=1 Tax=Canibacter zhoujuaniae TaxID=2708343 RepID=UPI001423B67C|nr:cupredoxin domain-containing protein [Canibacter zhoujuaniae]